MLFQQLQLPTNSYLKMLDTIQSKKTILTGDKLLLLYHSWTTFMTCMAFRASRGKCSKSLPLQYSRWGPGLEAGSQIATNCRDGPKNANACSCPSLHTPHLASKMRWSGEWCNHRASILSLNKTRKMQPIKWWSNFQHKFKKSWISSRLAKFFAYCLDDFGWPSCPCWIHL